MFGEILCFAELHFDWRMGVGGYLITIIVFIFYDQKEINDDDDSLGLIVWVYGDVWVFLLTGGRVEGLC